MMDDLSTLTDAELATLWTATLKLNGGRDKNGWPLPHPDSIKVTAELNRRSRKAAQAEWRGRKRPA